jgi:hypothetical protein
LQRAIVNITLLSIPEYIWVTSYSIKINFIF